MSRVILANTNEWPADEAPLSIVGVTGSGKSALAQKMAQDIFKSSGKRVLLLNVDAVAAYRDLDIGSAKPSLEERKNYNYFGFDLFDPDQEIDMASFLAKLKQRLQSVTEPIIIVGGSFFYERALVEGMGIGQASDPEFQDGLESFSNEELHKRLLALSAQMAEKIHVNDRYRLMRYLDLLERQALSVESLRGERKNIIFKKVFTHIQGVDIQREELKKILKERIEKMFERGWLAEVEELVRRYGVNAPALRSMGYSHIRAFLKKPKPLGELQADILRAHLNLAKRQRTWARGLLKAFK